MYDSFALPLQLQPFRNSVFCAYSSTGHLIRNKKAGAVWISYLRMGVFTQTSVSRLPISYCSRKSQACLFLPLVFLLVVLYCVPGTWYMIWLILVSFFFGSHPNYCLRLLFSLAPSLLKVVNQIEKHGFNVKNKHHDSTT